MKKLTRKLVVCVVLACTLLGGFFLPRVWDEQANRFFGETRGNKDRSSKPLESESPTKASDNQLSRSMETPGSSGGNNPGGVAPNQTEVTGNRSQTRIGKDLPQGASEFHLSKLESDCSNSVSPDGFGESTISGQLVAQDQILHLVRPCRVRLTTGSSLTLRRVRIESLELRVVDEGASTAAITIDSSELRGSNDSQLRIELSGAGDAVKVLNSEITYPLGIGLGVFGPKDGAAGATVEVMDSKLNAVGVKSEGITIGVRAAIGTGRFERLTMTVAKEAPLLMGPSCVIRKVGKVVALCRAFQVNEP